MVVLDGDVEVATCRVCGPAPPDLSVVEAVARLQLAANRLGWSVRVLDPSRELCELLDLVGLADVVACAPRLSLETGRQAAGGEHLGVEEVVPPGDLPS